MPRIVKQFHSDRYEKELRAVEIKLSAYNSYLYYCHQVNEGLESIDEVEVYLNAKTKFVNPRMSADAMGVLDIYQKIVELSNLWLGLDTSAIEEAQTKKPYKVYKIREDFKELIKSRYTDLYSIEESKQIQALEKALEGINKLDLPFRKAIVFHNREHTWSWAKQFTDNAIGERRRSNARQAQI
jgi:hypothetical protein